MVRAVRMTPAQLNALLAGGAISGSAAVPVDSMEMEDNTHEE